MSIWLSGNGSGDTWCRAMDLQFQASGFELRSSSFVTGGDWSRQGVSSSHCYVVETEGGLQVAVSVNYRQGRGCGFGP